MGYVQLPGKYPSSHLFNQRARLILEALVPSSNSLHTTIETRSSRTGKSNWIRMCSTSPCGAAPKGLGGLQLGSSADELDGHRAEPRCVAPIPVKAELAAPP